MLLLAGRISLDLSLKSHFGIGFVCNKFILTDIQAVQRIQNLENP
jgi:hypothetical protein